MNYKIKEDRIEVTHLCGHVQVVARERFDRAEERRPGFTHRQMAFMTANLCPGCFNLSDRTVF